MNVLVTGGAGYIGSITCRQLLESGYRVVIVDNFYSGHPWAVPPSAILIEGGAGDVDLISKTIQNYNIESVVHFAGYIVVSESVKYPLKYYENNVLASFRLIDTCVGLNIKNFIFSSSAAVYGIPEKFPISEDAPTVPVNPYGASKLMTEWMLRDTAESYKYSDNKNSFRYVALRYFNVAGASTDGTLGEDPLEATHLIKIGCQAACGMRKSVYVFGDDYDTPDGTCLRDYIHVEDVASAHVSALQYLERGGDSNVLNCGYGRGFSVYEVLNKVREVSGVQFPIERSLRRPGDPPVLIADPTLIQQTLGWRPKYNDIGMICESAFRFEKMLQIRNRSSSG